MGFPTKILYAPLPAPIRTASPVNSIFLYLITKIILSAEYRL